MDNDIDIYADLPNINLNYQGDRNVSIKPLFYDLSFVYKNKGLSRIIFNRICLIFVLKK